MAFTSTHRFTLTCLCLRGPDQQAHLETSRGRPGSLRAPQGAELLTKRPRYFLLHQPRPLPPPLPSPAHPAAPRTGSVQVLHPQRDAPLLYPSYPTARPCPPTSVGRVGPCTSSSTSPFSFDAQQTARMRWDRSGQSGGWTGVVGSATSSTPGRSSVGNFSTVQGGGCHFCGPSFPN